MALQRMWPVYVVGAGHAVVELSSQFLPILYPVVQAKMGLSYTQVGILALVASLGTSAAQPFFGHLSDRWGPRRLSAVSLVWLGLLMGMVGVADSYVALAVVIGLGVLGSAAYHPPGATLASSAGSSRRGASVSIFSVGGSVGSALSPLLVTAGMARWGTRGTLLVTPVAIGYALVLYVLLRRVRIRPRNQARSATPSAERRQAVWGLVFVVLTVMCLAWFQGSLRTYLPIWVERHTVSVASGSQMLFSLTAAMGVGSLIGGALSDRVGRWQMLAFCLVAIGPLAWLFVGASGLSQWLLVLALGAVLGATFPVSIVMAQETWPSNVGVASGLAMGIGWLPSGIGASVTGAIADRFSLGLALRGLVVPSLVGAVCIALYAAARRRSPAEAEGSSALPARPDAMT